MIHNLNINAHELLSCAAQRIQGARLDEILNGPFIKNFLRQKAW